MMQENKPYHLTKEQIRIEHEQIIAAQQNMKKFDVLYDRYYIQIFRYVLRRMGDETRTADITSQIFVKAMSNLKKYSHKGLPFSSWLYRIAKNEMGMFFRSSEHKRTITASSEDFSFISEELEEYNKDVLLTLVLKAIPELDQEDIELIEFKYFERRTYDEICEITSLSLSNAKVKTHRAIKKLKTIIEKSYHYEKI